MKNLVRFVLILILLAGIFGCAAETSESAAADARVKAADARADLADANARVKSADAQVKASDALVRATGTKSEKAAIPSKRKAVIPSGTPLKVALIDTLDSGTNSADDRFLASVTEAVVVNGATLLPKGTKVRGRIIEVDGAGRVKGRASIRLELIDIVQGNNAIAITTSEFAASSDSTQKRDAGIVAGGAGIGAAIGAIAGGKKGAAIGAITGGGAGTGVVLGTKGHEIHYGPETRLTFTLTHSVEM